MTPRHAVHLVAWSLLALFFGAARAGDPASAPSAAETGRDPTQWPSALRQAQAAASAASATAGDNSAPPARQVVLTEGRAYLVVQGRRYAVGDLIDGARLHRIDDKAVWWLEGGRVRREPLYGGVEKRTPAPAAAASAASAAARTRLKNSKETP